jgi:hypothetical protein
MGSVALIIMKKEEIISTIEGQKQTAKIYKIEKGNVVYRSEITNRYKRIPETQPIFFHIPFSEINRTMENIEKVEDIIQWLV